MVCNQKCSFSKSWSEPKERHYYSISALSFAQSTGPHASMHTILEMVPGSMFKCDNDLKQVFPLRIEVHMCGPNVPQFISQS